MSRNLPVAGNLPRSSSNVTNDIKSRIRQKSQI